jgi:SpoVK/Ycf46/Vps4 family AAA+-type ATPase
MVDIAGGLKVQLDEALKRAQTLYRGGQADLAAQEYERAARIMKDLVADAVSPTVQRQRLDKARQYLELAKRLRAGEAVAVTAEERAEAGKQKKAVRPTADPEKESEDDLGPRIQELITRTSVTWDQIGGLEQTKGEIRAACALASASLPQGVRLKASRNILLYGPSGTGKTLLAAAASNGLAATFFNVDVSSVLSKYFGESARLVSALFGEARKRMPSVVYLDEVDAVTPSRSGNVDGSERRLLSSFLSELDGLESKNNTGFLYVMGATNRPWDMDDAVLSRFGKLVYVPLPDEAARKAILAIHLDSNGLSCDMPRDELVRKTNGYSGRDIEMLCAEAANIMVMTSNPSLAGPAGKDGAASRPLRVRPIEAGEMEEALRRIRPKSDAEAISRYEQWSQSAQE